MRRLIECALLIVILLWTFGGPAWGAQQRATAPTPAGSQDTAATPAAIPVTDVIPSSERALTRLQDIRKELDADMSFSAVEAELPEFTRKVEEWWKVEGKTIQQLSSVQRLNDVTWQLRVYERQVAVWNALLKTISRKWSSNEDARGRLIADWQATQLALVDQPVPEAVSNKIIEVLREDDEVRRLFQAKTAQLVAVQGQLAARSRRLTEIRGEIEMVRQRSTVKLLTRDSPPLWTALFAAKPSQTAFVLIRDSVVKITKEGIDFFQLFRERLLVHLMLFLALAALFFHLRRLSLNPGVVMPTAAERFVLDRGFASALLVALFCVPLLYSDASPQMIRLIVIPAMIPIFILLPALFGPRLRSVLYFLAAVYVLDFWRYYLPPQWLLVRILLLVEALLGIGVLYLILRAKKIEPMASPFAGSVIRLLLNIAMGLFIGAIGANLLGNQSLGEMLFTPLVRTLYLGVVVRTINVVITAFALMALRTPMLRLLRTVQKREEAVAARIRKLANVAAAGLWIVIALYNVGAIGIVVGALEDFLDSHWKLGAVEISVRDVATFIVVFWASYVLSRIFRFILREELFPRFKMPRGVPDVLELLARYGVVLFGFLFALTSAGANLSQMVLALSALGLGIGFGLQNIVNNFVCGLILVFEHPIQVGDFVEVGPHFGKVLRIGFRSSSVNTLDGGSVIIPNSELIGTRVMNWSLSNQLRRISLRVPVPIGTEPGRVIEILQTVAHNQPGVVTYPTPIAAMEKLGDSALTFLLRCWTRTEQFELVSFGLTLSINNAFAKAGIQIPFAQTDVHVHWPENTSIEMPRVEKSK